MESIPATPFAKIKAEAVPVSSACGSKRKSMHDHIQELTSQDRSQRIKLTEVKEHEKTLRAQAKYEARSQLDIARLQHQEREAMRQREHEMRMMERQIELEMLRRGPPAAAMYGSGAPAYGAPPPNFAFDPALGM